MDAEQSYFQPAIDDIVLDTCAQFNSLSEITVFNTYQMYLKSSFTKLVNDLQEAESKGYGLGVKIVRGAYMVQERKRALNLNYPSPIQDNIEETVSVLQTLDSISIMTME